VTGIGEGCAELAALCPYLPAALPRDNTGMRGGASAAEASPVNPDVHQAAYTVTTEIPLAAAYAAEAVGEPWQPRKLGVCLKALPRFAERMHALRLLDGEVRLGDDVARWGRLVKLALGIRLPDFPVPGGWCCPLCDAPRRLMVTGAERFLRRDGTPGELTHPGLIWAGCCGETWPAGRWLQLGDVLRQAERERLARARQEAMSV